MDKVPDMEPMAEKNSSITPPSSIGARKSAMETTDAMISGSNNTLFQSNLCFVSPLMSLMPYVNMKTLYIRLYMTA